MKVRQKHQKLKNRCFNYGRVGNSFLSLHSVNWTRSKTPLLYASFFSQNIQKMSFLNRRIAKFSACGALLEQFCYRQLYSCTVYLSVISVKVWQNAFYHKQRRVCTSQLFIFHTFDDNAAWAAARVYPAVIYVVIQRGEYDLTHFTIDSGVFVPLSNLCSHLGRAARKK